MFKSSLLVLHLFLYIENILVASLLVNCCVVGMVLVIICGPISFRALKLKGKA